MSKVQERADWDWSNLSKQEIRAEIEKSSRLAHEKGEWLTLDELDKKVDTLIGYRHKKCATTR